MRSSWTQYLAATRAVIFVLDSNDRDRVALARDELHRVCSDEVMHLNFPKSLLSKLVCSDSIVKRPVPRFNVCFHSYSKRHQLPS